MTIKIHKATHKIINKNGMSLWLPANIVGGMFNLNDPDIYAQSATQLYPLGSKLEYADGRVFRYGKFGTTSTDSPKGYLLVNENHDPEAEADTDGFYGDLETAAVVGDEYVDLDIATAYAENFFEDGLFIPYPSTSPGNHFASYRICGSELGNGTYCRIYLDAPLKVPMTATDGCNAHRSIYSNLRTGVDQSYTSVMGVSLCSAFTANYFGWIQRRGRCYTPQSATIGDSAHERMVGAGGDGTIVPLGGYGYHAIGYLTHKTVSGTGGTEYWLQLE